MTPKDLDEIEAQIDSTVPYYVPALIAEIRALRGVRDAERQRECQWKPNEDAWSDAYWDTACNEAYVLIDGTLEQNHTRYCPFCGGLIKVQPEEPSHEAD